MPYQLNILVLFFGILQSWLIGFALSRKKESHPSLIYLILFILVVGLQLTFKAISKAWLWEHARTVYMVSYNLGYLIGPLIYFYFRARCSPFKFRTIHLLHFVPFIVSAFQTLLDEVFGIIIPSFLPFLPWPGLQLISLFAYGVAAWKLNDAGTNDVRRTMKQFLVSVLTVEAIIVMTIALLVRNFESWPDIRSIFVILTALMYWITYKLISAPASFSVHRDAPVVELRKSSVVKYANSGLTPEERQRILAQLQTAIDHGKLFTQPDINLDVVADRLAARKHHVSQVINEHYNRSFTELVNNWRLEEARSRLLDPALKQQKIAAVAYDVGFSSVSVFTTMFKKRFNVTPSSFRAAADAMLKRGVT